MLLKETITLPNNRTSDQLIFDCWLIQTGRFGTHYTGRYRKYSRPGSTPLPHYKVYTCTIYAMLQNCRAFGFWILFLEQSIASDLEPMEDRWTRIACFLSADAMPSKAVMCFVLELCFKANGCWHFQTSKEFAWPAMFFGRAEVPS